MRTAGAKISAAGITARRVQLLDLSECGVRWRDSSAAPLDIGTEIDLILPAPRWFMRPVTVGGVVVRRDAGFACAAAIAAAHTTEVARFLRAAEPELSALGSGTVTLPAPAAFQRVAAALSLDGRVHMLLIAAARSADGSSFVAAGTATALARLGHRVLLIDANLQNPVQHLRFRGRGEPGLLQLLSADDPDMLSNAIWHSEAGVAVLPAGSSALAPASLSTSALPQIAALVRRLHFSVVVIDAPPALESVDGLCLAPLADSRILTVRAGNTRRRDVTDAVTLFDRQRAPITGVVLNDHTDLFAAVTVPSAVAPALLASAPGGEPRAADLRVNPERALNLT
jgi:protein-tyrosine kinase